MRTDESSLREKTSRAAVSLLCTIIAVYRATLSTILPASCRFHPSCSEYAARALKKYGVMRGMVKTVGRVVRCAPWSDGGVDYP